MSSVRNMVFAGLLLASSHAYGSAIIGASNGTNTSMNPQTNGRMQSFNVTPGLFSVSGIDEGTVDMDVDAYAKHRSFDVNFSMANTSGSDSITTRTYTFNVTMNNFVGTGAAFPAQPAAAGDDIQNIEFEIVDLAGDGHVFGDPAPGNPNGGPFVYTNGSGNQVLRFGGDNGGGPAIGNGDSLVFTFDVITQATNAPWTLRMTANPEPGTLALAGLALFPLGIAVRRRRKAAQQTEEV